MNRKIYTLTLVLFSALVSFSQNQLSKWYFGHHAALDFMTTPPTILDSSAMSTGEGCSSMADPAGNLLFYTDGIKVWNRKHLVMENGSGLLGNSSSSQSSIIVKQSGNTNIYYIFTMAAGASTVGLNYSVVNMDLAAGLGSVTVLNAPLYNNQCTEQITATQHANGVDFWIVIHEFNSLNFRAYQLTSTGVNTTAVISGFFGTVYNGMYGNLKFSPNGQKLASAIEVSVPLVELYDFNTNTGVVSNPFPLSTASTTAGASSFYAAYGCEFSPDGTKFYSSGWGYYAIRQWDLSAGSPGAVISSSVAISSPTIAMCGAMQLAPNGKIYVATNTGSLHVINDPNVAGASCNYAAFGQPVSTTVSVVTNTNTGSTSTFISKSNIGLPNIFAAKCAFGYAIQGNNVVCNNGSTATASVVNLVGNHGSVNYSWTNGSLTYYTAQVNALTIGNWTITVIDSVGCEVKKLYTVSQTTTALAIMTSNANSCAGSPVTLSAGGASTYTWSTGSQAASIVVNPTISTQYSVSATDQYNCVFNNVVSINVTAIPEVSLNTGSDNYTICAGDALVLSANGANSYAWSANGNVIANTQTLAVAPLHNAIYYVTGITPDGCESLSIPVSVTVFPKPTLSVSNSTTYCSPQILTLTASGTKSYYWEWNNVNIISTAIIVKVNTTTQYTVTGTDERGCKSVEVVTVTIGCVGVDELNVKTGSYPSLRVYPNPVNEVLNVEYNSSLISKGGTIKVFNTLGSIVLEQTITPPLEGKREVAINVSELPKGIYFVKVGNEVLRFMKE
ncbi:MAG: T9SS type A sorting domain-containing protein [Bacteroidetes bacterium]|nr:T9SS type A sorting domain-containing protein [Bacteroidota bacterium]